MKRLLRRADETSRRRFMANAAKAFLGVGLYQMSRVTSEAAIQMSYVRPEAAENVIYLYMKGGMSHLDTFDIKTNKKVKGPVRSISTNVDGIRVSEYLPGVAKHMDKIAIINSLNTTQGAHQQGTYYMHTSYKMRSTIQHPYLGSWLSRISGKRNPDLPSNVIIGNNNAIGVGFFDSKYAPVIIGNPNDGLKDVKTDMEDEEFMNRLRLANELDKEFLNKYAHKDAHAYTKMYSDAIRVMKSADLKAFDLNLEDPRIKESYGNNNFGQGCLLARRLVEHKVRFVEVAFGGWDTHSDNFSKVSNNCRVLDQALSALLSDLFKRGMLSKTLVVLATEFGRTPNINGRQGRDHHPRAFSCLLAGGGVRGGIKYGKTDDKGHGVIDKKMPVPDFNATIAHALDLPLSKEYYSATKRPFRVADKGKPALDLFS